MEAQNKVDKSALWHDRLRVVLLDVHGHLEVVHADTCCCSLNQSKGLSVSVEPGPRLLLEARPESPRLCYGIHALAANGRKKV